MPKDWGITSLAGAGGYSGEYGSTNAGHARRCPQSIGLGADSRRSATATPTPRKHSNATCLKAMRPASQQSATPPARHPRRAGHSATGPPHRRSHQRNQPPAGAPARGRAAARQRRLALTALPPRRRACPRAALPDAASRTRQRTSTRPGGKRTGGPRPRRTPTAPTQPPAAQTATRPQRTP